MAYQFIIFISVVQSILFLTHWFLYRTFTFFFDITDPTVTSLLKIILILFSLSLVSTSFLVFRYPNLLVRIVYVIAASWIGFLNFFVLSCLSSWIIYLAARALSFSPDRKLLACILFGLAIAAGIYGIVNAGTTRVTNITARLPNLPEYWRGKTAVWISDVHLGAVRRYGFAKDIADRIQQLKPDLIFVGGDLFDGGTVDLNGFMEPFSRLSAPDGIYFVTGNHEEFTDPARYLKAVRQAGIRVLNNEVFNLKGLQIIGVDYRDSQNRQKYEMILNGIKINPDAPAILLKHSPSNLDIANRRGITLQLSGHTHKGQIFPVNFITALVYHDYDYGLKKFRDLQIYTSSGVGTWGPPMRVGNVPEIAVIKFE
jgi:predicted MPP superfamily phosphohydrolase